MKRMKRVDKKNAVLRMKVVRGKEWDFGNQDMYQGKPSIGQITSLKSGVKDGWVEVTWEGDSSNSYRIGYERIYDLAVYKDPKELDTNFEEIEI